MPEMSSSVAQARAVIAPRVQSRAVSLNLAVPANSWVISWMLAVLVVQESRVLSAVSAGAHGGALASRYGPRGVNRSFNSQLTRDPLRDSSLTQLTLCSHGSPWYANGDMSEAVGGLSPLLSLQDQCVNLRFISVDSPPNARGMIWSSLRSSSEPTTLSQMSHTNPCLNARRTIRLCLLPVFPLFVSLMY